MCCFVRVQEAEQTVQSVRLDLINEVTEGEERAEITKDSVYSHGPRNLSKARRQVEAQKK